MKRTPLIIIIVVVILALGAAVILGLRQPSRSPTVQTSPTPTSPTSGSALSSLLENQPTGSPSMVNLSPLPSPSLKPLPTTDTFVSSGVTVANFYKETAERDSRENTTFIENTDYNISYNGREDSFLISITGSPFEDKRQLAEQAFVTKLKVSQTDACRLKVSTTTPAFANPDQAGKSYPLSFCQK